MSYVTDGLSIIELQSDVSRDPRGGAGTVRRWIGLRSSIEAMALTVDGFLPYVITAGEGPSATLEVTYAGGADPLPDEAIEVNWNVRGAVSQAPLAEFTRYATAIAALSDVNKDRLNKVTNGQETYSTFGNADVNEYVLKRLSSIDSYFRPSYSFSYQARYPANTGFYPSMAQVGTVYSKAVMTAALNVPLYIAAKIVAGQYLCESIDFEPAADGSKSLTMSFIWGSYDPDLYTIVS